MLAEQTQQNIRMAFGPKVLAALLLPKLLEPTDFVVFFSSVAAVLGSPGQVPYSAANAALDGYCAFAVRSQGTRMLSVQWGPWKEAGMAANEKALRRARDFGFGAWSNDQGFVVMSNVSFCNALSGNKAVVTTLKNLTETMLGHEVSAEEPLMDAGMDSLLAVEFARRLSREFGQVLPVTIVFDCPTLGAIADRIKRGMTKHGLVETTSKALPVGLTNEMALVSASSLLPFCFGLDSMLQGLDCVTGVPFARLDLDVYYSPDIEAEGMTYTKHAACMDGVEWFGNFFNINATEARTMDPQQRLLLDTAVSANCKALERSDAAVVVGGTHVILSPVPFIGSCAAKMLSKVGRCLTLDASADGYCRGEGVGALILQPSADAKVAEILSVATNHDGRSASLTAPNGKAQENLFRTSLALASLQTVDVVELHGTGTKLGDPLEAASTMAVFGKSGKPVCGAVKSNMGHLEGSAGMAGLFKLICTLRNKAGPPNLHLKCLNQHISSNIIVSEACADLRQGTATLSGAVSSFGFGGSNAQALLMPGTTGSGAVNWAKGKRSKSETFLPWRRLLIPLLRRDGESDFAVQLDDVCHLFNDHEVAGGAVQGGTAETIEMKSVVFKAPAKISDAKLQVNLRDAGAVVLCGSHDVVEAASVVNSRELPKAPFDLPSKEDLSFAEVNLEDFYHSLESQGVRMGPRFRVLQDARRNDKIAVAELALPADVEAWEHALQFPHWSLLDGAFQLLGALGQDRAGMCVPFSLESCCLSKVPIEGKAPRLRAWVRLTDVQKGLMKGDAILVTSTGKVVASCRGLAARSLSVHRQPQDLYQLGWQRLSYGAKSFIISRGEIGEDVVKMTNHDGCHVLALPCWKAKAEEEEIEDLTLRAIEMLRVLQQAAANKETWFVVVAGNGAFAEACFSAVSSMLRSALCEQPLDVQVVHVNATTWESVRSILAETKLPLISEDPICRVVDGVLEAPRLQKWVPDGSVARDAIRKGGRYVVTGGSGALGESCVHWLLGRGAGH
ncbi:Hybrid PKS-NRPS synthetase pynA (Pyranonigrin biosynthesis cluster protein A), partial [Durusdinium trenchii]